MYVGHATESVGLVLCVYLIGESDVQKGVDTYEYLNLLATKWNRHWTGTLIRGIQLY
jgi:hypothetical protein